MHVVQTTSPRRAAVLGQPIAHSLSPVIHRAGFAAAGLTGWDYEAIECAESALPGLVAGLGPEWAGLSVTMPLKEAALRLAADVRWDELLHDWQVRSEHDGGYSLLRCRLCGTEVVR